VIRADFLATTLAALATPRPEATRGVFAEVGLSREGTALLAPFTISIALHNPTANVVRLRFPTADLFRIDVLRGDAPIWSSVTGHRPIPVLRQIDVPPGLLRLAQQIVDGTTDDHHAFAPGRYTVRVSMLGENFGVVVDKTIGFDAPDPIARALNAKFGSVLTVEGEPYIDGGVPRLRDESGSIRLSHALALRASGHWVVRGFLDALNDERVFDVGRSAPAFGNLPSPLPVGL
jgi:hypothetical protein